ncbi:hypothetical protein CP49_41400 [Bradyrhizobium valentinum]|uniref:Uncharacterized protein n=1 Tax=Bradyrhizobium valentinum TaxID=1518501 RepID=A0A0R3M0X4_9BRAD|nr:hypothetical protein CP49_41400 [Bradyrhizobium valentinum]
MLGFRNGLAQMFDRVPERDEPPAAGHMGSPMRRDQDTTQLPEPTQPLSLDEATTCSDRRKGGVPGIERALHPIEKVPWVRPYFSLQ